MPCCCDPDILSIVADFSNIFTALAGLALAAYVFLYQRQKDELTNRLEWFKDLIIEPNKDTIYDFFDSIDSISKEFNSPLLTDLKKIELLSALKTECYLFRRNFVVLLRSVDPTMEQDIKKRVDKILDAITQAAFDVNVNLADDNDFEIKVSLEITHAKNYVLSRIFKYDGK